MWHQVALLITCVMAMSVAATCPRILTRRLLTGEQCPRQKHVFAIFSAFPSKAYRNEQMGRITPEGRRERVSTQSDIANLAVLYEASAASRSKYAAKHNYTEMSAKVRWSQASLHPSRDRLRAMLQMLDYLEGNMAVYDPCVTIWVWALDSDAVIMNMNTTLESIVVKHAEADTQLLVGKDCTGVSFGSVLLKAGPWTKQFLSEMEAWAARYEGEKNSKPIDWERSAFERMENHTDIDRHVTYIPQEEFNSFPTEMHCGHVYRDGDFVLHFAGSSKYEVLHNYIGKMRAGYLQTNA